MSTENQSSGPLPENPTEPGSKTASAALYVPLPGAAPNPAPLPPPDPWDFVEYLVYRRVQEAFASRDHDFVENLISRRVQEALSSRKYDFVEDLVARLLSEESARQKKREDERRSKKEERRRESLKIRLAWFVPVISLLTALGVWQLAIHIPETIQRNATAAVETKLRPELDAKITADLKPTLQAITNAVAATAATKDTVETLKAELFTKLTEAKEGLDKLHEAEKTLQVAQQLTATETENSLALQKLYNSSVKGINDTTAGIVDTVRAAAALVPDSTWSNLALPVGTILYVDPQKLTGLTGHDSKWWNDPTTTKSWQDSSTLWVPLLSGTRYSGSQFDKLGDDSPVRARANQLVETMASSAAGGVLVIRINGPLP